MTKEELIEAISSNIWADRDTLREAFNYAFELATTTDNPTAVMTAVMVVTNTIAKELKKMT